MQLKINKEGNPRRPVISSMNCHTSEISQYVDYHPQWIVKDIPFYIQVSDGSLWKLRIIESILENAYLLSTDLKWLYKSITNSEGILFYSFSIYFAKT